MKKTARQPAGDMASNQTPPPIANRPDTVYHSYDEVESMKRWEKIKTWWNDAKFEVSIKAIFIFAVVVSFSHTIELYSSVGFDDKIVWLNDLLRVDFITLALFATLAAEAAFAVGLWGLYEAYKKKQGFPSIKEFWQIWTLFGSGLLVVGWSNIGGTVGYDFIVGQPVKGIALGLSIPLFVLGAVLVNFKRKHPSIDQPSNQTQPISQPMVEVEEQSTNIQSDKPTKSQPSTIQPEDDSQTEPTIEQSANKQPANSTTESTTVSQPNQPVDRSANHTKTSDQPANQGNQSKRTTEQPTKRISQENEQSTKRVHSQPAITTSQSTKKKQSTNQSTIQPAKKVVEVAEKYRAENGEWPSQRQLAELADVTRYQAAKVLSQLKKQPPVQSTTSQLVSQANG
ncbi:hypothetical protein [Melghirimyces algeriensis]|uniref:DUF2637 domain-containing protein n=1 Tax=Melghirimyces algeriensis TaxID=910412 RepID=A0A521C6Y1_9BACL|nr:hypothetical protein [Melghirimyces algeriensis]SMO55222.1 hypothetical protein SAMN06264849_103166 [Melghirimyces algeriensis]